MKHKVSELEGALLDAAVAKAEGLKAWITDFGDGAPWCAADIENEAGVSGATFAPSSAWKQGGPIIERERIMVGPETEFADGSWEWEACMWSPSTPAHGPTPLTAAMRAYVASKFGEEVELP
jgi:hypothetical protein